MTNYVLSPIDPEILINRISEKVTASILNAVRNEQTAKEQKEKLLTVKETAEFLSLSVATIYSKCSKGELEYFKRSKRLYFSSIQLMDYLKEGHNKSNSEIEKEAEAYLLNNKKGLK